jgi:hypothetical protein
MFLETQARDHLQGTPCETCAHCVMPKGPRSSTQTRPTSAGAWEPRQKEEEQATRTSGPTFRQSFPLFEAHCGLRSSRNAFLICGSMRGVPCEDRTCKITQTDCLRCAGEMEPCLLNTRAYTQASSVRIALGERRLLRARQERSSELFSNAFEETIEFELINGDDEVAIVDDERLEGGLTQTVLLFGGPGSGKTYLFKKILRQYLAQSVKGLAPGGLLLDPKGVLVGWTTEELAELGREPPIVLGPGSETPTNILDVGQLLTGRQLGHLVADVIISSYRSIGEGWDSFIYEALEGAVQLLQHMNDVVTLSTLVESLTVLAPTEGLDGKPTLVPRILLQLTDYLRSDGQRRTPEFDRVARSFNQFISTLEAPQTRYIAQLIRNALGPVQDDNWRGLSETDKLKGLQCPYESAFQDGRVILVSIGEGEPLVRSVVSTIVKALFQIVTSSRLSHSPASPAWSERSVFLACDEYAQVLTERGADGLSDSMFFSRSREFKCFNLLALQSVHMGLARVGSNDASWNSIVGNANTRIFMSVNDADTAALAAGMAGRRQVLSPAESWSQADGGRTYSLGGARAERSAVPEVVLLQVLSQGDGVAIGRLDGRVPETSYIHVS